MKYIVFIFLFMCVVVMSCRQSSYDRMEERELSRNVRYDSIFLGVHFGMIRKDFYTSCWELNKKGLIMQGPGNLSVQYELDTTQLKSKAFMRFYPNFQDDKLSEMPVEFTYEAWAPWNQHLSADSLLIDVKNLFERWYGGTFTLFENPEKNLKIWARVDGNRRIRLYVKNISTVKAEFVDLTVKKEDKKVEPEKVE